MLGGLHEKRVVQRGICVSTVQLLKDRGNSRKSVIMLAGLATLRVRIYF